ncbi:MAG: hypothetical protein ABI970_08590 [Chloroflexota bacterium]|nr:hypothetical protein [Anaerolineae bacterium]
MLSLKKRLVVGIALLMLLVATVLPAGAQDNGSSSSPSPVNGTSIITIQIGGLGGFTVSLSLPIRCGNNC